MTQLKLTNNLVKKDPGLIDHYWGMKFYENRVTFDEDETIRQTDRAVQNIARERIAQTFRGMRSQLAALFPRRT